MDIYEYVIMIGSQSHLGMLQKEPTDICYLNTSGNWQASTLDRKNVKIGKIKMYFTNFYSLISGLWKNQAN